MAASLTLQRMDLFGKYEHALSLCERIGRLADADGHLSFQKRDKLVGVVHMRREGEVLSQLTAEILADPKMLSLIKHTPLKKSKISSIIMHLFARNVKGEMI